MMRKTEVTGFDPIVREADLVMQSCRESNERKGAADTAPLCFAIADRNRGTAACYPFSAEASFLYAEGDI